MHDMASLPHIPPGPPGHWFSGNLPEFRQRRLEYLRQCARTYGDVVALRFAQRRILLLSHPDLIEEVLVTQNQNFIKHFALRLNPLLLGKGLLTSEGDFWLRQRRLVQPAFVRSRISAYAPAMVDATLRLLASWQAGQRCNIHAEMMKLTLDIAAQTLFHADAAAQAQEIAQALRVLQEVFAIRFSGLMPVPLWLPTPGNIRLRRAVRRLDPIIFGFIRHRRQEPQDNGDLLSLLLEARDADDGSRMTDQQVRDEAMTLFLAGHETTALVLSWAWYLLAQDPEVEARLLAEIDQLLGNRLPAFEDVAKLRYTEAVLLEAMRLYPPAYTIGREALADCQVGGYLVKKGTTVLLCQWVVQRDPRFFHEPDAFRPERWLGEAAKKLPKFAYFPFGGGPRLCVGNTFALMEMTLVLATLAPRFRFTIQPEIDVKPVPAFTLHPVPGIPAIITPRELSS
jgi:cytochrome P450